jgi:hypothetical protein
MTDRGMRAPMGYYIILLDILGRGEQTPETIKCLVVVARKL